MQKPTQQSIDKEWLAGRVVLDECPLKDKETGEEVPPASDSTRWPEGAEL